VISSTRDSSVSFAFSGLMAMRPCSTRISTSSLHASELDRESAWGYGSLDCYPT
jgi:hypothetical protein